MRKEVLVAVLLGGALGLAIAFGVWRANLALSPKPESQVSITNSSSPTPEAGMLLVTDPDEDSLVTKDTITLKGRAEPKSSIVVTTLVDSSSTVTDNSGNWTADIKLDSGANEILVTAINEQGEEFSTELTVTFSKEFKAEQ